MSTRTGCWCGSQKSLRTCQLCSAVVYCSAEHQFEHFLKRHRDECSFATAGVTPVALQVSVGTLRRNARELRATPRVAFAHAAAVLRATLRSGRLTGMHHSMLGDSILLAYMAVGIGDVELAKAIYQACGVELSTNPFPDRQTTEGVFDDLQHCCREAGLVDTVEEILMEHYNYLASTGGAIDTKASDILLEISTIQATRGDFDLATQAWERGVQTLENVRARNPATVDLGQLLQRYRFGTGLCILGGRPENAHGPVLRAMELALQAESPEALEVASGMALATGSLLSASGRLSEALQILDKVYVTRKQLHGEGDEQTIIARKKMNAVRKALGMPIVAGPQSNKVSSEASKPSENLQAMLADLMRATGARIQPQVGTIGGSQALPAHVLPEDEFHGNQSDEILSDIDHEGGLHAPTLGRRRQFVSHDDEFADDDGGGEDMFHGFEGPLPRGSPGMRTEELDGDNVDSGMGPSGHESGDEELPGGPSAYIHPAGAFEHPPTARGLAHHQQFDLMSSGSHGPDLSENSGMPGVVDQQGWAAGAGYGPSSFSGENPNSPGLEGTSAGRYSELPGWGPSTSDPAAGPLQWQGNMAWPQGDAEASAAAGAARVMSQKLSHFDASSLLPTTLLTDSAAGPTGQTIVINPDSLEGQALLSVAIAKAAAAAEDRKWLQGYSDSNSLADENRRLQEQLAISAAQVAVERIGLAEQRIAYTPQQGKLRTQWPKGPTDSTPSGLPSAPGFGSQVLHTPPGVRARIGERHIQRNAEQPRTPFGTTHLEATETMADTFPLVFQGAPGFANDPSPNPAQAYSQLSRMTDKLASALATIASMPSKPKAARWQGDDEMAVPDASVAAVDGKEAAVKELQHTLRDAIRALARTEHLNGMDATSMSGDAFQRLRDQLFSLVAETGRKVSEVLGANSIDFDRLDQISAAASHGKAGQVMQPGEGSIQSFAAGQGQPELAPPRHLQQVGLAKVEDNPSGRRMRAVFMSAEEILGTLQSRMMALGIFKSFGVRSRQNRIALRVFALGTCAQAFRFRLIKRRAAIIFAVGLCSRAIALRDQSRRRIKVFTAGMACQSVSIHHALMRAVKSMVLGVMLAALRARVKRIRVLMVAALGFFPMLHRTSNAPVGYKYGVKAAALKGPKVKQIFWDTLADVKQTIWSTKSSTHGHVFKELFPDLKDLFTEKEVEKKKSTGPVAGRQLDSLTEDGLNSALAPAVKLKPIEFVAELDGKRAYQMNISLSKFKKFEGGFSGLAQRLREMDLEAIGGIEGLYVVEAWKPTGPEIARTKEESEKLEKLKVANPGVAHPEFGYVESYVLHMISVPRLSTRLESMKVKATFPDTFRVEEGNVSTLEGACDEILHNQNLVEFLVDIVRPFGNELNKGTKKAGAQGIKLSGLMKLAQTKTADNKMTSLYYLISVMKRYRPHLLELCHEFKNCRAAQRIPMKDLVGAVKGMRVNCENLKKGLAAAEIEKDDFFVDAMAKFAVDMDKQVSDLESRLSVGDRSVTARFEVACKYLGEDPAATQPEEFFKEWWQFIDLFSATLVQFRLHADQAEKKARQEAAAAATVASTPDPGTAPKTPVKSAVAPRGPPRV